MFPIEILKERKKINSNFTAAVDERRQEDDRWRKRAKTEPRRVAARCEVSRWGGVSEYKQQPCLGGSEAQRKD